MLEGVQKILMKGFLIHTDIKVRTLGEEMHARVSRISAEIAEIQMQIASEWKCYLTLAL